MGGYRDTQTTESPSSTQGLPGAQPSTKLTAPAAHQLAGPKSPSSSS